MPPESARRYLEGIVKKHAGALRRYGIAEANITAETDALRRHLLFHAGLLEVGSIPGSAS